MTFLRPFVRFSRGAPQFSDTALAMGTAAMAVIALCARRRESGSAAPEEEFTGSRCCAVTVVDYGRLVDFVRT